MAISIGIGDNYYSIGGSDFLHSFFSTISFHLEPNGWGTKYPTIMNELYKGSLKWSKSEEALKNVLEIKEELTKFQPDKIIWDINDLSKRPPWGNDISPDITDLSNYFVTNEGEDLFEVLMDALNCSIVDKNDLLIE